MTLNRLFTREYIKIWIIFIMWCEKNYLLLNINKHQVISFLRNTNPIFYNYQLNNNNKQCYVHVIKDLNIHFESNLTFKDNNKLLLNNLLRS